MIPTMPTVRRWFLWVLMAGLLVQGVGSLIFRLEPALAASAPYLLGGILGIDIRHAWVHIVWGVVGIAVLTVGRSQQAAVWLALIFGVFYTALGIAGVLIPNPFGLTLGWFENSFHLTAGPAALLLGLLGIGERARVHKLRNTIIANRKS